MDEPCIQPIAAGPHQTLDSETVLLLRSAAEWVIAAVVVGMLYFGRPVLMPFALAVLLAFALGPIASALVKLGLPRKLSAICAVSFAVLLFIGLSAFIAAQFARLAIDLPRYQSNLTAKIESIGGSTAESGIVNSAAAMFKVLDNALVRSTQKNIGSQKNLGLGASQTPIPVEIKQQGFAPFEIVEDVLSPLVAPLATAAVVIVFVGFILLQKEDLRDRFISLVGAKDLQRTTVAIDDAARRLSRYLLLQTSVNGCFGLIVGSGLFFVGVPDAGLWGLIGALFRFVPYVGVPMAAAVPLALSFAADPGWTMLAFTALLFFGTEAIVGQAIEPWLYGRHMGLSAIAVVLSAGFWTWIWGPVGLLLSTPLTMCIAIIGRNVEQLRFLHLLLGNQAALSPEKDFYLRMLAGKPEEAAEKAEARPKDISLADYFDQVAIPGLSLAQTDFERGALDAGGRTKIRASVEAFIANLSDAPNPVRNESNDLLSTTSHDARASPQVLCVAGKTDLDFAAACLMADLLIRRGVRVRLVEAENVSFTRMHAIGIANCGAICLSYLSPGDQTNARYVIRRLRKLDPKAQIVAGFWNSVMSDTDLLDFWESTQCDGVATRLNDAVAQLHGLSAPQKTEMHAILQ